LSNVKLPSLQRLVRLDALYDKNQPLNGFLEQPIFELDGDGVQILFEHVVRRNQNRQSVLLHSTERLRRVNAALIEYAIDSIVEEFGDDLGRAFQRNGVALRCVTHP